MIDCKHLEEAVSHRRMFIFIDPTTKVILTNKMLSCILSHNWHHAAEHNLPKWWYICNTCGAWLRESKEPKSKERELIIYYHSQESVSSLPISCTDNIIKQII